MTARKNDNPRHASVDASVLALLAKRTLAFAAEAGLDANALALSAGLQQLPVNPLGRVPHGAVLDLVHEIGQHIGGPGLQMARHFKGWNQHVLGFLMATSRTPIDAFGTLLKFQRAINNGDRVELLRGERHTRLVFRPRCPEHPATAQLCYFLFFQMLVGSQDVLRSPLPVLRLRLTESNRVAQNELRDAFAPALDPARTDFSSAVNEIVFSSSGLDVPNPGRNDNMHAFFAQHAVQLLQGLPRSNGLQERLRKWLADEGSLRTVGIREAAAALRMSPRSLQRYLRAENTSLRNVVDDVRRQRACDLLEQANSVSEVAYQLGYSEPSAFRRAFRRWTGMTPSECARKLGS